jgi:hypothetical protein
VSEEDSRRTAEADISRAGPLRINRRLQLALAILGAAALGIVWQTWQDLPRLFLYDVPASLAMSAYVAQISCEGLQSCRGPGWWARVVLLIPMSAIPAGRLLRGWSVSGHLADILAVSLIQSVDKRLSTAERAAYWIPVPAILWIRWFLSDKVWVHGHWETYHALLAAAAMFAVYVLAAQLSQPRGKGARP